MQGEKSLQIGALYIGRYPVVGSSGARLEIDPMATIKRGLSVCAAICSVVVGVITCAFAQTPDTSEQSTSAIKAQTVIVVSNGLELRMGSTLLTDRENGRIDVQSNTPNTVWVFRDFVGVMPKVARTWQELGVQTGKAYYKTADGWSLIGNVDLTLTDQQIATQFGIQLPTLSEEARQTFLAGDLNTVQSLLKQNPNLVSSRNVFGNTPLTLSVWRGHQQVIELLLTKGADVNEAVSATGDTPLHLVVKAPMTEINRLSILELLLAKGADVNARNKRGETPLYELHQNLRKSSSAADILQQNGGHE